MWCNTIQHTVMVLFLCAHPTFQLIPVFLRVKNPTTKLLSDVPTFLLQEGDGTHPCCPLQPSQYQGAWNPGLGLLICVQGVQDQLPAVIHRPFNSPSTWAWGEKREHKHFRKWLHDHPQSFHAWLDLILQVWTKRCPGLGRQRVEMRARVVGGEREDREWRIYSTILRVTPWNCCLSCLA